jgi:serine/threonine protein kinase
LQVLAHVALRLRDLHAAGSVHRDIKPENIMLLHRKNRWTLIDFGSVAKLGSEAPLSLTLHYAAPETVAAWREQRRRVVVTAALDAWSLGVVAFELLTRQPAFQMLLQGRDEVRRCHAAAPA